MGWWEGVAEVKQGEGEGMGEGMDVKAVGREEGEGWRGKGRGWDRGVSSDDVPREGAGCLGLL